MDLHNEAAVTLLCVQEEKMLQNTYVTIFSPNLKFNYPSEFGLFSFQKPSVLGWTK